MKRLLRQADENPEEVNAWAELGDFYRQQGRGPEAVSAWMHANALLEYSDPSALTALGGCDGVGGRGLVLGRGDGLLVAGAGAGSGASEGFVAVRLGVLAERQSGCGGATLGTVALGSAVGRRRRSRHGRELGWSKLDAKRASLRSVHPCRCR